MTGLAKLVNTSSLDAVRVRQPLCLLLIGPRHTEGDAYEAFLSR